MITEVHEGLKKYIEENIIPMYDGFDSGHRRDHVRMVIDGCMEMAGKYDVDINMLYTAAAYHDTGLTEGRDTHHIVSGKIIRNDRNLYEWFTDEQIETIACAAEDHRASAGNEPRSIYGLIVAEADRNIDPLTIIRRTVQYGLAHYPEFDREGQWRRTLEHLHEKYAEGGYLKLWVKDSPNAARLEELRAIISDEERLHDLFDRSYQRQQVLDFLERNQIPYTLYNHPPLFTIEEALAYWKDISGCTHCKNLFFRNHKGNRHYLVSFECHKKMDIHSLEHVLRQGKLSFASEERMMRCLGLKPGSVSPLGLINDIEPRDANPKEMFDNGHRVKLYLDADLEHAENVSFHPSDNMASVVLKRDDFLRFLSIWNGEWEWLEMQESIPDGLQDC